MFSITLIVLDGQVEYDALCGPHVRLVSVLWIFTYRDTYRPLCVQILMTGQVEYDALRGPHVRLTSVLWIFTCRDTYRPLYVQILLTTKKHVALWMPVRLTATASTTLQGFV
jgi:hypothetical protein